MIAEWLTGKRNHSMPSRRWPEMLDLLGARGLSQEHPALVPGLRASLVGRSPAQLHQEDGQFGVGVVRWPLLGK